MRQVAKLAGVSVATVSYVLNNDPRITRETREKVMAAVRALDYHPNSLARGLARQKTDIVGLLLPRPRHISDPFLLEFVAGVGDVIAASDMGLLLLGMDSAGERLPQQVLRGGMDGVILLESEAHDKRLELLRARSMPFVLFGRCLDDSDVDWIDVDNEAGARMAVEHLAALGHRRIAFIGAPSQFMFARFRREGYQQGLRNRGLPCEAELIREADLTREGGQQAACSLLSAATPPTAILAASDLMAIGCLQAARELGIRVPAEVAVVGFDGTPLAGVTEPPLTTVRQPSYDIGASAARMMLDVIHGKAASAQRVMVQPSLIVRRSCGSAQPARTNFE